MISEFARVHDASTMREKIAANRATPPAPRAETNAIVFPFPANRQLGMIHKELRSVVSYDNASACRWLTSVARKHRRRLINLGIAYDLVEADTRALSEAFGLTR